MDAKKVKKVMKPLFVVDPQQQTWWGLRSVVIVGASVLWSVGDQKEAFHMTDPSLFYCWSFPVQMKNVV